MFKKKLVLGLSVLLIGSGGLLLLLGYPRLAGLSAFGVALAVFLVYREQQSVIRQAKKASRVLENLRHDISEMRGSNKWYGTQLLDFGNSTYTRVREIYEAAVEAGLITNTSGTVTTPSNPRTFSNQTTFLRAGRTSTPHVENPKAVENLEEMLDPSRKYSVAGVFADDMFEAADAEPIQWRPGTALATLKNKRPDIVLLDERYLDRGQWSGLFTASGIALITQILESIEWCNRNAIPVYLIVDSTTPDVYTQAIRSADVVRLPFKDEMKSEAYGAALTPVLTCAQEEATKRQARQTKK